jgi:hypothetical protein
MAVYSEKRMAFITHFCEKQRRGWCFSKYWYYKMDPGMGWGLAVTHQENF